MYAPTNFWGILFLPSFYKTHLHRHTSLWGYLLNFFHRIGLEKFLSYDICSRTSCWTFTCGLTDKMAKVSSLKLSFCPLCIFLVPKQAFPFYLLLQPLSPFYSENWFASLNLSIYFPFHTHKVLHSINVFPLMMIFYSTSNPDLILWHLTA